MRSPYGRILCDCLPLLRRQRDDRDPSVRLCCPDGSGLLPGRIPLSFGLPEMRQYCQKLCEESGKADPQKRQKKRRLKGLLDSLRRLAHTGKTPVLDLIACQDGVHFGVPFRVRDRSGRVCVKIGYHSFGTFRKGDLTAEIRNEFLDLAFGILRPFRRR